MKLTKHLKEYKGICGRYPSQQNGLKALVDPKVEGCDSKAILSSFPIDPWGNEIKYLREGEEYFIFSEGAQGIGTSKTYP